MKYSRKWSKGLVLVLCLCFSLSAFAGKRLVYMGPVAKSKLYHSNEIVRGDIEYINRKVIKDYVENRPNEIKRLLDTKFIGYHDGQNGWQTRRFASSIKSQSLYKDGTSSRWLPLEPSFIPVSWFGPITCPDGSGLYSAWNDSQGEHPAGCYKWIEESQPDPDFCDPSYYEDGIVPEDCPKTEPQVKEVINDTMCEKITRPKDSAGAVACDDKGNVHPCIWTDHLNIKPKAAEDIIRFCYNVHEKRHIETRNKFITSCGPTEPTDPDFGKFPNTLRGKTPNSYRNEMDAYVKTVGCFADNIDFCENDPACVKRINDEVKGMRNMFFKYLRDYNAYCSKPENNCEQIILKN